MNLLNKSLTEEDVNYVISILLGFQMLGFQLENYLKESTLKMLVNYSIIEKDLKRNIFKLTVDLLSGTKPVKNKYDIISDEDLQRFRRTFFNIKKGTMGDKNYCRKKLSKWLKNNPTKTIDDVIKVAEIYLETTPLQYIMQADYFIEKNGRSKLDSLMDELSEEEIYYGKSI